MIPRIQGNLSQNFVGTKSYSAKKSTPNFTGKNFIEYVPQKRLAKFMSKLKWFDGEQGRILITAIGTGIVAPLFIAWNPYVKPKEGATQEEKDNLKRTQKYTAMRQPISAALAIPIQMSLVKPIEKGLDTLFNNPKFSKFMPIFLDKSALQDAKYIERQEKSKLKGLSKKDKKEQLAKKVKAVEDTQVSEVAKNLLKNGQIRVRPGAEGLLDNKSVVEAIKNEIRRYTAYTNALRYDSFSDEDLNKLFENPSASLEEITNGKDFYVKRATTLIDNKAELQKTLKDNLPADASKLTSYFEDLANKTNDTELKKVYQEFVKLKEGDAQQSRAARTLERISKIEDKCGGSFTPEKYLDSLKKDEAELLKRLKKFADISKNLKEEPESIKETISKLAENCKFDSKDKRLNSIFHDLSTFGENTEKLTSKIGKDIVKNYKNIMKNRYRFIKEVAGISLGLFATVPITCHVLNWVYPRFMDIFFPNLSGKKPANDKNGGEK